MIERIIAIACILISILSMTLIKTYYFLPYKELKRRGSRGDHLSRVLFRAVGYGGSLKLLLWLFLGMFASVGIVLLSRVLPPVVSLVVVATVLWFNFLWISNTRLTSIGIRLTVWCTPAIVWLVSLCYPVLSRIVSWLSRYPLAPHSGMYEQEDFTELLEQQKRQNDNRMSDEEIKLMRGVLKFGDYKVRDVLTPRKEVKSVSATENIGPVLLHELHSSGYASFPVYDGKPKNIVGTLPIRSIIAITNGDQVSRHYDKRVEYLNENDSLAEALRAFYVTKQHLFVVVDSFNEYLGIVTIDDILVKLIKHQKSDNSEQYQDRKYIAARYAKPVEDQEKLSEASEEMIE